MKNVRIKFGHKILGLTFVTSQTKGELKKRHDSESSYGMVVARYKKYREQPCYNHEDEIIIAKPKGIKACCSLEWQAFLFYPALKR